MSNSVRTSSTKNKTNIDQYQYLRCRFSIRILLESLLHLRCAGRVSFAGQLRPAAKILRYGVHPEPRSPQQCRQSSHLHAVQYECYSRHLVGCQCYVIAPVLFANFRLLLSWSKLKKFNSDSNCLSSHFDTI